LEVGLDNTLKKETVNVTCRMDKTVYDLLARECENQGISLNSIVNSVVKKYLAWERFADKIGFVPLTKRAVKQLYENIDKDTIKRIANDVGSTVPREMMALTFTDHELYNIVQLIQIWSSRFGTVRADNDGSSINIIIHHGISKNFSEYMAELHKAMAESLSFKLAITKVDEMFIQMKVDI
jgi:hypothetical protein